ncbi:MAG: uncharacterized protein A8A55_2136 [Amphiamblys sp. WSBS2006]|nr:MAG: uncharacterized protein A8A55_2136 [Amphiamblys sp. WSBS2006]
MRKEELFPSEALPFDTTSEHHHSLPSPGHPSLGMFFPWTEMCELHRAERDPLKQVIFVNVCILVLSVRAETVCIGKYQGQNIDRVFAICEKSAEEHLNSAFCSA